MSLRHTEAANNKKINYYASNTMRTLEVTANSAVAACIAVIIAWYIVAFTLIILLLPASLWSRIHMWQRR